jgi:hypothetical protein
MSEAAVTMHPMHSRNIENTKSMTLPGVSTISAYFCSKKVQENSHKDFCRTSSSLNLKVTHKSTFQSTESGSLEEKCHLKRCLFSKR